VEKAEKGSITHDQLSSPEKECFSFRGRSLSKQQHDEIKLPVGFEGSMYALGKHMDLFAHCDSNSTYLSDV